MLNINDEITSIDEVTSSEHNVIRVNSISKLYKTLRQNSKVPTFALTYDGTYMTLMKNVGLSEKEAKSIENSHHELYKVSGEWREARIQEASKLGYITVAFGLRLRTPLLKQVIMGTGKTPHEANSEARTAGNDIDYFVSLVFRIYSGISVKKKLLLLLSYS